MEMFIHFHVRFFAYKEVVKLKNRVFMQQSEQKRRRKLRIVLRKLTGTQLSRQQRLMIERAVQRKRQYRLRIFSSPQSMRKMLQKNWAYGVRGKTLFGSITEPPMAVLFQYDSERYPASTVCIYIPNMKKEEVLG